MQDGQSGYLSQSVAPLYFGLGEKDEVDRIEIDWPSGTKQTFLDGPFKTNKTLLLDESVTLDSTD